MAIDLITLPMLPYTKAIEDGIDHFSKKLALVITTPDVARVFFIPIDW